MRSMSLLVAVSLGVAACGDAGSGGAGAAGGGSATGGNGAGSVGGGETGGSGGSGGTIDPCGDTDLPEENLGTGADPEAGEFTLDEALAGLPEGPGPLRATIETTMGAVTCELFPDIAPNGVANFVGLARGRRPFKDGVSWIKGRRFYDGLIFHRVIDDFMAQTGDPLGTGFGGPGYNFADEFGTESHTPGTLAYANTGTPNTNSSQFYIVAEVPATFLDGEYVIFGRCEPVSVVKAITEVPVVDEKPVDDVVMTSVSITRCAL